MWLCLKNCLHYVWYVACVARQDSVWCSDSGVSIRHRKANIYATVSSSPLWTRDQDNITKIDLIRRCLFSHHMYARITCFSFFFLSFFKLWGCVCYQPIDSFIHHIRTPSVRSCDKQASQNVLNLWIFTINWFFNIVLKLTRRSWRNYKYKENFVKKRRQCLFYSGGIIVRKSSYGAWWRW